MEIIFKDIVLIQIDLKKVKFYILPSIVASGKKGENLEDAYCVSVEPEVRAAIDRVLNY